MGKWSRWNRSRISGQVTLRPQPRDLAGDVEHRMRHLTGDHVHLVGMGGGDDHVGLARARLLQHIGMRGKTDHPLHLQRVGGAAHQRGVVIHDRDIVGLARKLAGDLPADLPRPADDDLHGATLLSGSVVVVAAVSARPQTGGIHTQRFQLAVQAERSMPTKPRCG
jgi:hypothetical protein